MVMLFIYGFHINFWYSSLKWMKLIYFSVYIYMYIHIHIQCWPRCLNSFGIVGPQRDKKSVYHFTYQFHCTLKFMIKLFKSKGNNFTARQSRRILLEMTNAPYVSFIFWWDINYLEYISANQMPGLEIFDWLLWNIDHLKWKMFSMSLKMTQLICA